MVRSRALAEALCRGTVTKIPRWPVPLDPSFVETRMTLPDRKLRCILVSKKQSKGVSFAKDKRIYHPQVKWSDNYVAAAVDL